MNYSLVNRSAVDGTSDALRPFQNLELKIENRA